MQTLYEKIGGQKTIEQLVTTFYENVLSDPLMSPFFKNSPMEKLEKMQKAFFTIALGGPDPDINISLYEAHRNRGIERQHLTRFIEHLMDSLSEIGIDEDDAKNVYRRIATYSDEVLGETSVDG